VSDRCTRPIGNLKSRGVAIRLGGILGLDQHPRACPASTCVVPTLGHAYLRGADLTPALLGEADLSDSSLSRLSPHGRRAYAAPA
jgi:hypothetical protein